MPAPTPLDFYVIIPDHTQLEPICTKNTWTPSDSRIDLIVQGCSVVFQCETINSTLAIRSTNPKYLCEALAQEGVVHMVCYEETQAKNLTDTSTNKYDALVTVTKDLRTELEATRTELKNKEANSDDLHSQFVALTIKHKALKTENEKLLQSLAAPSITGKAEWPRIRMENRNEPSTRDCAKTMKAQAAMITLRSEVSELTKENNTFRASLVSLCTANKELADALLMAYTK